MRARGGLAPPSRSDRPGGRTIEVAVGEIGVVEQSDHSSTARSPVVEACVGTTQPGGPPSRRVTVSSSLHRPGGMVPRAGLRHDLRNPARMGDHDIAASLGQGRWTCLRGMLGHQVRVNPEGPGSALVFALTSSSRLARQDEGEFREAPRDG
jgi:hypothetical protein